MMFKSNAMSIHLAKISFSSREGSQGLVGQIFSGRYIGIFSLQKFLYEGAWIRDVDFFFDQLISI